MNKRGHVLNALLLAIGIGYVLQPAGGVETFRTIAEVSLPLILGALFPDVDTAFGRHRKTLHNLLVLGIFYAWPALLGNLQYVWIGVATHYVLDVVGTKRGIALLYPLWDREFNLPVGVPVSSGYSDLVTAVVTGLELGAVFLVVNYGIPVQDLSRRATAALGL